jgi:hypothetical protein
MPYRNLNRPIPPPPIIERAYDLARSGEFQNVIEICQRLKIEGYSEIAVHFDGAAIRSDLTRICSEARGHRRDAQM